MEQRLVRARRRLRAAGHHEAQPPSGSAIGSTPSSPRCLLSTDGHWSSTGDVPIRRDLCRLALGLAGSLHELVPDEPDVAGLQASSPGPSRGRRPAARRCR
jgi:RNA polymerase sigma-70 factor (ECF subfamily)